MTIAHSGTDRSPNRKPSSPGDLWGSEIRFGVVACVLPWQRGEGGKAAT